MADSYLWTCGTMSGLVLTPEDQVGVGSIRNSVKTKLNIMEVGNKMRSHIHCGDPGSYMHN